MEENNLVKLIVNLVPKANEALNRGASLSGDTRTDTINRALILYTAIQQTINAGGGVLELTDIPARIVTIRVHVNSD